MLGGRGAERRQEVESKHSQGGLDIYPGLSGCCRLDGKGVRSFGFK